MDKFSPFEKLVGKDISDEQKEEVLRHGENMFNDQNFQGLENEREKTAEELEMINIANQETNKLLQKYGLNEFDVPAKNIHIVNEQDWKDDSGAVYKPMLQAIGIRTGDIKNTPEKTWLMRKIFHEMLHFKSHNAFQLVDSEEDNASDLKPYRCGLAVHTRDGKDRFLNSINEAVIEEITKRFIKGLSNNPIFSEEMKQTKELAEKYTNLVVDNKKLNNDDIISAKIINEEMDGKTVTKISTLNFTYETQRENLNILITKLFYRNVGDFENKEQIFDIFEKAVMTGNILPVGRLIDSTFGEGAFRKIGELDGCSDEEQKSFIDSL